MLTVYSPQAEEQARKRARDLLFMQAAGQLQRGAGQVDQAFATQRGIDQQKLENEREAEEAKARNEHNAQILRIQQAQEGRASRAAALEQLPGFVGGQLALKQPGEPAPQIPQGPPGISDEVGGTAGLPALRLAPTASMPKATEPRGFTDDEIAARSRNVDAFKGITQDEIMAAVASQRQAQAAAAAAAKKKADDEAYERKFEEDKFGETKKSGASQRMLEKEQREKTKADAAARRLESLNIPSESKAKTARVAGARPPTDSTVNTLSNYDAALETFKGLRAQKGRIDTGPIASPQNTIAQVMGIDDAEVTKFKADTANSVNDMISALSGANVPKPEMDRLNQGLPRPEDNDTAFLQKLNSKIEQLERARRYLVGNSEAAGRNMSGFGGAPVDPLDGGNPADDYFGG